MTRWFWQLAAAVMLGVLLLAFAPAVDGEVAGARTAAKGYYIPEPPPDQPPVPAGISGLWYDPALEGEGYNFIFTATSSGPVLVVFFYGYDGTGERLWLVSENIPARFEFGAAVQADVFEARGGTFDAPAPSAESLTLWGTLFLVIDGCASGTVVLDGVDGQKVSSITRLAGIEGLECESPTKGAAAGQAGLWFDASLDGEGYNVIASDVGTIVFFYGYNAAGERVWLISDVAPGPGSGAFTVPVWEAVGGTFAAPAPSSDSLRAWGTISVDLDCNDGSITLDGADGVKTSAVVKLAGIQGTAC